MGVPDFGEGSRPKRRARRLLVGIGAVLAALIVALLLYAVLT